MTGGLVQVDLTKVDDHDNILTVTNDDAAQISRFFGGSGEVEFDGQLWLIDFGKDKLAELMEVGYIEDAVIADSDARQIMIAAEWI